MMSAWLVVPAPSCAGKTAAPASADRFSFRPAKARAAGMIAAVPVRHLRAPVRGFTLIELMVTIAILVILLGVGVPSFQAMVQNSRATALANDLVSALNLARSEAVRRGESVSLCASADGSACGGNWIEGWIVHLESDEVLRVWDGVPGQAQLRQDGQADGSIGFGALGDSTGAGSVFVGGYPGCSGNRARQISVNGAGRISVVAAACADL